MIAVLLCLLLAAALFFLLFINRDSGSYVEPLAKDSAEMEMAQFLSEQTVPACINTGWMPHLQR